jgi:hypothetical protein
MVSCGPPLAPPPLSGWAGRSCGLCCRHNERPSSVLTPLSALLGRLTNEIVWARLSPPHIAVARAAHHALTLASHARCAAGLCTQSEAARAHGQIGQHPSPLAFCDCPVTAIARPTPVHAYNSPGHAPAPRGAFQVRRCAMVRNGACARGTASRPRRTQAPRYIHALGDDCPHPPPISRLLVECPDWRRQPSALVRPRTY